MKLRQVFALVGIILLLTVGVCGTFIWIQIKDWASSSYSPSEYPLQIAKTMLDSIAAGTSEPDVTPEPWEVEEDECKALLRSLMTPNNNEYTLTIYRIFGDHGTHIPGGTGSDEVLLHVTFPDGSHVELYFYNINLSSCRKIID
ncbi:MAG: hypothetical protein ABI690_29845 [Chloroflexota bacterium]